MHTHTLIDKYVNMSSSCVFCEKDCMAFIRFYYGFVHKQNGGRYIYIYISLIQNLQIFLYFKQRTLGLITYIQNFYFVLKILKI